MALVTGITTAALVGGNQKKALLGDQEYYDRFIRPQEERLLAEGRQSAAGVSRGGKIRQQQFAAAQGLGGTAMGESLASGLDPVFRRSLQRALETAQLRGEELRRQKFAERDRKRAELSQILGTVSGAESSLGSAILSATPVGYLAPLHGALTAGAGLQGQLALQTVPAQQAAGGTARKPATAKEMLAARDRPLRTIDYGTGYLDDYDTEALRRSRGGGGLDLYRTYGI